MTPEEFAKMEDEKDLFACRSEIVKVLVGKSPMIAIASLLDVIIALVESTELQKSDVYKKIILVILDAAKQQEEKK